MIKDLLIRTPSQPALFRGRVLVWFSCGAASACAAKLTLASHPEAEILYCDMLKYEHPDNRRFISDCERWFGKQVKILKSAEYTDIFDVFDKTGWLVGHGMAKCSHHLKRDVREAYQEAGDIHIFGMTADEKRRIKRYEVDNPELYLAWPLVDAGMTKQKCFDMLQAAGIELPMMYRMGYKNNNCIGCVKGGKGYFNKVRVDFPDYFWHMARQERKMGVQVIRGVWLDELDPSEGVYVSEFDIECGPVCNIQPESENKV